MAAVRRAPIGSGPGRTFGADTVSPESFPGYHNFPYNTTQVTYSAPINSRMLLEAGFSRFAYDYARFGMAAPDGLMDLIPVTEQSGIYGRPQFTYRGVFDPLDFGFNDNKALQTAWRAALSYVTGAHNLKVGYQGYFSAVHNGRVPNHTQLRYTFNNQVPISVSLLPVAALGSARSHRDVRTVRPGPVDGRAADAAGRRAVRSRLELGAGRRQRRHGHLALQPAADFVRGNGQRPRLQRHHAAPRDYLRRLRHRQDRAQGERRQVSRSRHGRRHLQLQQPRGPYRHAHRVGAGRGARLDRRQRQLRGRLRSAEPRGPEQPGHRR